MKSERSGDSAQGDKNAADQAAVDMMRKVLNTGTLILALIEMLIHFHSNGQLMIMLGMQWTWMGLSSSEKARKTRYALLC